MREKDNNEKSEKKGKKSFFGKIKKEKKMTQKSERKISERK